MCRKGKSRKEKSANSSRLGKDGFTLVELCVVLALILVLTTMTVSFSVLMHGFASDSRSEYSFLEDCSKIKEEVRLMAAENDLPDSVFSANNDGTLTVTRNGTDISVSFTDGVLSFGDKDIEGLGEVDGVSFSSQNELIKCVIFRINGDGQYEESSFVFSLRSGMIGTGEGS